jgi:LysR family nitrogen assimilation transcriptional regulator
LWQFRPRRQGLAAPDRHRARLRIAFQGDIPINLRQLQYFARTIETGNITRAAEQLYVAQPALGLQIRQLEQELGVPLLQRHSRGVSPTRAGQILYERACEILRLVEETERQVTAAGRQEREGIVLGLTNGFANIVGRELVQRARRELSGVNLSLVEERSSVLIDGLEKHEIDIALAYEVHERPGLLRIPLLEEQTLFVCSPEVLEAHGPDSRRAKRRTIGPDQQVGTPEASASALRTIEFMELAAFSLVMPGPRDGVRQQVLATAKRLALPLEVILDVSSVSMMKNMVANGDAAAVMPYGNVIDEIARGRIVGRRIVNPPLARTLYLVRPLQRAQFKFEAEVLDLLAGAARSFSQQLGALATPLDALQGPSLADTMAVLQAGAQLS